MEMTFWLVGGCQLYVSQFLLLWFGVSWCAPVTGLLLGEVSWFAFGLVSRFFAVKLSLSVSPVLIKLWFLC